MRKKIVFAVMLAAVLVMTLGVGAVLSDKPEVKGNGAPSGQHYNLNLIGVNDKDAEMTGNSGHRIFVKLWGNTKIWLAKGDDYQVLDANGTDGNGAKFMLPDPDPGGALSESYTAYSVYVRVRGKPTGSAKMRSFIWEESTNTWWYSLDVLDLDRLSYDKFKNVSKELLTVNVDADIVVGDDTYPKGRYYLFDPDVAGLFWGWDYQNSGLKLAQLRFYPQMTEIDW